MSTPTAAPPAWLEAAAKLDSLLGDKVPLSAARAAPPEANDEVDEPESPDPVGDSDPRAEEPAPEAKPRPRIVAPVVVPPVPAPSAEEVDLAWHGYAAVALLPSTLALAAVTVGAVALRPLAPARVMHEAVGAPLAALWLLQTIRAVYRVFAYHYRLTTRRLFRERGRLYPAERPLDLALVVRTEVRQNRLGRLFGVGSIRVISEDATPTRPAVELCGVRRPKLLATRIEEAAQAAREGNVIAFASDQQQMRSGRR